MTEVIGYVGELLEFEVVSLDDLTDDDVIEKVADPVWDDENYSTEDEDEDVNDFYEDLDGWDSPIKWDDEL